MQKKMNLKIKFREGFRPFAPCIIEEDVEKYFESLNHSPYMLFVTSLKKELRMPLPENFNGLNLKEKLYFKKSHLPAITHIDFSARVQTVSEKSNKKLYRLLEKFKECTGHGILINTSFNVRGEPIVCTPEDAFNCFIRTEMDYLVLNNFLVKKSELSNETIDMIPIQKFDKD
jgi:carbamoyltransferase